MSALGLIAEVERLGGELALRGERIRYRLPHTPDAPRLVEELRAHREEVLAVLRERYRPQHCGSPNCAGCYSVGDGRRIHPPKTGLEYREWLERWEGKGRVQLDTTKLRSENTGQFCSKAQACNAVKQTARATAAPRHTNNGSVEP